MEKEKEIKQKKNHDGLLWIITIALLIGGTVGYYFVNDYLTEKKKQEFIETGLMSPDPVQEAISETTWEELPVGLIYEVPEELQEEYLGYAKAKYEKYKDLGPQQRVSEYTDVPLVYLEKREDVIPRYNEKPSDMLNNDFSLRYPDMFFGFIIHDEKITGNDSKYLATSENRNAQFGENFVQDKMNQILFVEDYYSNGGRLYGNETLARKYLGSANGGQIKRPQQYATARSLKSGFLEEKKNVVDGIFEYMFTAGNVVWNDAYQDAYEIMAIKNTEYFKEADNIDDFPEKYNDVDSWEDSYPVFYYPTKVWKIDNNTIVVDFEVVNGDRMASADMYEILAKLIQSNQTTVSKNLDFANYETIEYSENMYMVLGRFFDSEDITNGLLAEHGTHILNYTTLNNWYNGCWPFMDRGTYVFNDKAKDFLSDFYDLLENDLNSGKIPSTRQLLKKAASMNNISYNDAMSIYSSYYVYATMSVNSAPVDWD